HPSAVRGPHTASSPALGAIATVAVLLAAAGILIASTAPDGIIHLAQQLGLAQAPAWMSAPMAGYQLHTMPEGWMGKAAAGLAGLILIYGLCLATGRFLTRQRSA